MNITFSNHCEHIVHLRMEAGDIIKIQPHSMVVVNCEKNNIHICIKRNISSFKKKINIH